MFICKRCCPCCKSPPKLHQEQHTDTKIHLHGTSNPKDKPFGFVEIYPGVNTSDNTYNCPMLAIHLYRHSKETANVTGQKISVVLDNSNNEHRLQEGQQQYKVKEKANAEVELILIPVEDVLHISSKAEIQKDIEADTKAHIEHVYEDSENCCDRCCRSLCNCSSCCRSLCSCGSCCKRAPKIAPIITSSETITRETDRHRHSNVRVEDLPVPKAKSGCFDCCRCWCCRLKVLTRIIRRTKIVAEEEAKRFVTITIEYLKYSNLDTPTNTRLLSEQDKLAHYKKKFDQEQKIEFFLFTDTEPQPTKFESKIKQAGEFCRAVMGLKGMRGHYPSPSDLKKIIGPDENNRQDKIIGPSPYRTIGDVYEEPTLNNPVTQLQIADRGPSHQRQLQQPPQQSIQDV
ncbi:unnamed protein product [Rotaria socialis]|uniref:Uncharacterized protein n=1 Tax=Rotaria socialis TaxID=392032 RepID=A0A818LQ29_9BILA|nr:unnamed protein product [Rotaria socialis]CAF3581996.1 unnamed protein product [Rotaria socialis]CAF3624282.1 unnamed protein product [Rotaria socialis]CAF4184349.1 unnamed protein product [Rotaria socialis]CAF4349496.1 unnamed protein product [Rotaria socialis]